MNMSVENLILLLSSPAWPAIRQWLAGYSSSGLITSIALGFVKAFLGTWIARQFPCLSSTLCTSGTRASH
jgi:hypothetical protein